MGVIFVIEFDNNPCDNNVIFKFQSILKAYLRGVWDSVKGVSLIFIVIRDTCNSKAIEQNEKQTSELEESTSTSSSSTHASKRPPTARRSHTNKRELNKLKEYAI